VYQKQLGSQPPPPANHSPIAHSPVATPPGPGQYQPQPAQYGAPGQYTPAVGPNPPLVTTRPTQPAPAPSPVRTGPLAGAGGAKRPDPRNLPNPTKIPINYNKVTYNVATRDPNVPPPPAHSKYIVNDRGKPFFFLALLSLLSPLTLLQQAAHLDSCALH